MALQQLRPRPTALQASGQQQARRQVPCLAPMPTSRASSRRTAVLRVTCSASAAQSAPSASSGASGRLWQDMEPHTTHSGDALSSASITSLCRRGGPCAAPLPDAPAPSRLSATRSSFGARAPARSSSEGTALRTSVLTRARRAAGSAPLRPPAPTNAEAEGRLSAALGALFPSQHCQLAAVLALGCRAVPGYERVEALRVAHGELMYIVEHNHLQWGEPPHVRLQPEKYRGQLIDILLERPGRLPALARWQDPAVDRVTVLQHVLDRIGGGKPLRDWEAQHGPPTTRAQQVDALAFALRQWADFKKMGAWVTADWGSWADGPQYSKDSVLYLDASTDDHNTTSLKLKVPDGKAENETKEVSSYNPGDAKYLLGLGFQLGAGTCCDVELPKAEPDAAAPPRVPLVPFLDQLRQAGVVVAAHNAANDLPCIARELLEQGRVEDVLALVAKPARCTMTMAQHVFPRCKFPSLKELCDLLTAARIQELEEAQKQGQRLGESPLSVMIKRPSKASGLVASRAEDVKALHLCHEALLYMVLAGSTYDITEREASRTYTGIPKPRLKPSGK
ncbi:hypothetical protein HYH03_009096 [Edaphochlamys debaryana]|uniref:Uncharacterized protein n=1 Tax=Edaphochlamys debaryana TaxID=47281 RepID=A0A835Y240_9CHLO|nr:hypothetical protein HYH03_009096 [Edaphochlamys debaryana]|eukprot:KAG2492681.1 hypothetical protein HYH03_009096 [Edaphochlamys debaryana]